MEKKVYEFDDYVAFLEAALSHGPKSRGRRSALARHLGCQNSFVSLVLTKRAHFSLEHAIKASQFLQLSADEQHFFLLLIERTRAGCKDLENYFDKLIADCRIKQRTVKDRIRVKEALGEFDQATYYSMWWYAAIHILVGFPHISTRHDLSKHLNLPLTVIDTALAFLLSRQLVHQKGGSLEIGKRRIHVDSQSPFAPRHHINWRLKTIEVIDRLNPQDLHYSALIGISRDDAERLREMLLEIIQKSENVVRDSKEEAPFVFAVDFFEL